MKLLLFILLIGLLSCQNQVLEVFDKPLPKKTIPELILNKWTCVDIEGTLVDDFLKNQSIGSQIEFFSDGTYETQMELKISNNAKQNIKQKSSGKYEFINNNKYLITHIAEGIETKEEIISISEDSLITQSEYLSIYIIHKYCSVK